MNISKNEQVQNFLDELMGLNDDWFVIVQKLREIVFAKYPQVNERIMYGGIMFYLTDDFGGLFVSNNHVSFEFGKGYALKDPGKLLEGKGKLRRHLKIRSLSDIENKNVAFFVKQVKKAE